MLKKAFLVMSLGILLAMALASVGCASGSGLSDMLARVPADTKSLKYVDVSTLRNDADLDDLYDAWKASVDSRLEARGIDHGDVDVFASNLNPGKRFTLLVGNFDLAELRDELDDRHYDDDEYKGVEVWKREAGWGYDPDNEVALMGNLIILGNEAGVEACIKVIKEGEASWLSKVDINDVVSRLPGGLYVDLQKTDLAGLLIKGLEASGTSFKKQDRDTLRIGGVAKFDDEDDADDAENTIENLMEQQEFDEVSITQQGEFLKASAELDIDDAASLFQGL